MGSAARNVCVFRGHGRLVWLASALLLAKAMGLPGKLLVVEAEPTARRALAELLRGEGFSVETAADGDDALEKAAAFAPDVVLTDMAGPSAQGARLVESLRQGNAGPAVVGMGTRIPKRAVPGLSAFVEKPFRFSDLVEILRRCGDHPPA